jgi:hypothetical protein
LLAVFGCHVTIISFMDMMVKADHLKGAQAWLWHQAEVGSTGVAQVVVA